MVIAVLRQTAKRTRRASQSSAEPSTVNSKRLNMQNTAADRSSAGYELSGSGRAFAENRRKSLYPSPLFYGFPRPRLYPHGKRRCSAPGAPAQQAEADLARIKEVRSCRKSNGISKRSNESGWLFSGRCVSDTPSCLGENPGRAT